MFLHCADSTALVASLLLIPLYRMVGSPDEVMSKSVPFLPRNPVLDEFPLAADVGFGKCFSHSYSSSCSKCHKPLMLS
jgi:hypothetical protein